MTLIKQPRDLTDLQTKEGIQMVDSTFKDVYRQSIGNSILKTKIRYPYLPTKMGRTEKTD